MVSMEMTSYPEASGDLDALESWTSGGTGFVQLLANPQLWMTVLSLIPAIAAFFKRGTRKTAHARGDLVVAGDFTYSGPMSDPTTVNVHSRAMTREARSVEAFNTVNDVVQYLNGIHPSKFLAGHIATMSERAANYVTKVDPPPMTSVDSRFTPDRTALATAVGFMRLVLPFSQTGGTPDGASLAQKVAALAGTVPGKIDQLDMAAELDERTTIFVIDARMAKVVDGWYGVSVVRRAWIVATIMAESGGTQFAVSKNGSMGPAQLPASWWKSGGSVWTSPFSWTGTAIALLRFTPALEQTNPRSVVRDVTEAWKQYMGREPEQHRIRYLNTYIAAAPTAPMEDARMSEFSNTWRVEAGHITNYRDPSL